MVPDALMISSEAISSVLVLNIEFLCTHFNVSTFGTKSAPFVQVVIFERNFSYDAFVIRSSEYTNF